MKNFKNILIGLLTALAILLAVHNIYQDKAIKDIKTKCNSVWNIQRSQLHMIFDLENAIYETDSITGDREKQWNNK